MPIPEADWKNQRRRGGDWLTLLLVATLVTLYLYLWVATGLGRFPGLIAVLVGWALLYVSRHWQPIFYLLPVVVLVAITGLWLFTGDWRWTPMQVTIALNIAFVGLCLYLFLVEEIPAERARG